MIGLPPACARCGHEAIEAGQLCRIADRLHLCKSCWRWAGHWFGELSDNVIRLHGRRIDMAALPSGEYRLGEGGELVPVRPAG